MRTFNKMTLLAGVSTLALGLGMSQASAFDTVAWDWNKTVEEDVNIDVDVDVDVNPTGLVQVEKLQISLGDKSAVASLQEFRNDPHQSFEDGLTQTTVTETTIPGPGNSPGTTETVEVTVDLADPINALRHLPQINVSSLAIGNSESITSTVPVLIHEGQFAFGEPTGEGGGFNGSVEVPVELAVSGTAEGYIDIDSNGDTPNESLGIVGIAGSPDGQSVTEGGVEGINGSEDPLEVTGTATGTVLVPVLGTSDWLDGDNEHTALADTMLSLALQGLITPAQMSATSSAGLVVNAAADISATSIANNHAIQLDAGSADDAVVVADLVQFAYANNTANASLGVHTVSNYVNLGALENATSNVSAVAGGNISNITVNSFVAPAVEVPGNGDGNGNGGDTN